MDPWAGEQRIKNYIWNNIYISQDFSHDVNLSISNHKGIWNKKRDSKKCNTFFEGNQNKVSFKNYFGLNLNCLNYF